MKNAEQLAEILLEIKALKLSPLSPFTWTSGYRMPVYNDNRKLLSNPAHRRLVADSFAEIISRKQLLFDLIGGVATAGIPHATTLADQLASPLVYIREQSKGHGMRNQVEGILDAGKRVLVVEDLVSTGKSSVAAVQGVRTAGGQVTDCLAIFSYGFPEIQSQFKEIGCLLHSVLTFDLVLTVAQRNSYITSDEAEMIRSWQADPFGWGERSGFPKIVKAG